MRYNNNSTGNSTSNHTHLNTQTSGGRNLNNSSSHDSISPSSIDDVREKPTTSTKAANQSLLNSLLSANSVPVGISEASHSQRNQRGTMPSLSGGGSGDSYSSRESFQQQQRKQQSPTSFLSHHPHHPHSHSQPQSQHHNQSQYQEYTIMPNTGTMPTNYSESAAAAMGLTVSIPRNHSDSSLNLAGLAGGGKTKNQNLMNSLLQSSLHGSESTSNSHVYSMPTPTNASRVSAAVSGNIAPSSSNISHALPAVLVANTSTTPTFQQQEHFGHSLITQARSYFSGESQQQSVNSRPKPNAENSLWNESFQEMSAAVNPQVHSSLTATTTHATTMDPSRRKISDAQTYGPRFCILFDNYRAKFNFQIDTRRHLMSLCVEHMISFIKWARDSETQSSWISTILLENDYLRPEVRNGVVMVLIYTFASIKAQTANRLESQQYTNDPSDASSITSSSSMHDMFTTLQDAEKGLGIANKFSLKIYNDPFEYLSFLKTSISALIDAGIIPDNERQNQPKQRLSATGSGGGNEGHVVNVAIPPAPTTSSVATLLSSTSGASAGGGKYGNQGREELQAFQVIAKMLIDLLDAGDNTRARALVRHVTAFWQLKGKVVRNRRFATALNALSQPIQTSSLELSEFGGAELEVIPAFATEAELAAARAKASSDLLIPTGDVGNAANSRSPSTALLPRQSTRPATVAATNATANTTLSQAQQHLLADDDDHDLSAPSSTRQSQPKTSSTNNNKRVAAEMSNNAVASSNIDRIKKKGRGAEDTENPPEESMLPPIPPSATTADNANSLLSTTTKTKAVTTPVSLQALRFERVAPAEWEVKETRIFDCQAFAKMLLASTSNDENGSSNNSSQYRTIALIDEVALFAALEQQKEKNLSTSSSSSNVSNRRLRIEREGNNIGLVSLEQELQTCGALVTSWPYGEFPQFEAMLTAWRESTSQLQVQFAGQVQTLQNIQQRERDRDGLGTFGRENDGATVETNVTSTSSSSPEEQVAFTKLQDIESRMKMNSLLQFWKLHSPSSSSSSMSSLSLSSPSLGYIGYELDMTMILLIRANEQLGLMEDIWCTIYPKELQDIQEHSNFRSLLSSLFPQIAYIETRLKQRCEKEMIQRGESVNELSVDDLEITNNVMIKYYAHKLSSSTMNESDSSEAASVGAISRMATIPPQVSSQYYKTIGTFATPPGRVIARVNPGPLLHDFILELL